MFFQTPASRSMFTLFCLWVNILAIVASPLPYGNGSKASPPGQFGPPLPPPRRIQDLRILTTHIGDSEEHSSLVIGTTCVHAMTDDRHITPASILTPKKSANVFDAATLEGLQGLGHRVTSLGTASFRDQADEEEAIEEMLGLRLPRFTQDGGNCMDFLRLALRVLIRRKNVKRQDVMPKFEEFYGERMVVFKEHWGTPVKKSE
ncbi:hypothetical protein F5051DRAFT_507319 [Lentinula edodes]|nr:hypothetical protein F5051DRAFT_507319 [Lentinula edodes]